MYEILKSAHSGWRYVVLVLLVFAVVQAVSGWLGKKAYTDGNRKFNVFTLISAHIQLVFGAILYFLSPLTKGPMSDPIYRHWKVEHITIMILAIVLITIGNAKSKKVSESVAKHKNIAVFFGIALVLLIVGIFMIIKTGQISSFFGMS